jgi:hypothetical protein
MTPCRYHEGYGGGRWREWYMQRGMVPPLARRPTCRHPAIWMLTIMTEAPWPIPVCSLHRRAVDARNPTIKNNPGRWTKL